MNDMMDIFNPYFNMPSSKKAVAEKDCGDYTPLSALPENPAQTMAYVPFQLSASKRYEVQEALSEGTLFPVLNKPFLRTSRCCANENE